MTKIESSYPPFSITRYQLTNFYCTKENNKNLKVISLTQ